MAGNKSGCRFRASGFPGETFEGPEESAYERAAGGKVRKLLRKFSPGGPLWLGVGLSERLIAADRNAMTVTLVGKVVPKRLVLCAAIVPKCE
jgi:hypothetical protein